MRRQSRQHPLQSFRFWFLILVVVSATAAWKLGLSPFGSGGSAPQMAETQGIELGEGATADDLVLDAAPPPQAEPFPSEAYEPMTPPAEFLTERSNTPLPRANTPDRPIEENPFGPAEPEFVAVEDPRTAAVVQAAGTEEPAPAEEPVVARADNDVPFEPVDFTEIDALLEQGTIEGDVAAHRLLSELYWQQPNTREQLYDRIDTTARRIYFQPQPHYMEAHLVRPGDALEAIAKEYDVTYSYLAQLNRVDPNRIRAGQKLKVIKGPFNAVVDLSDYELTVHCYGFYVYRFPVGIGKDGATPIGTFTVEDKVVNPPYYGPEGAIAADDPANPIGERWISIGDGYGIHGTIDPDSIGRNESRGCIRMHNEDVATVYDLLTVGSEVVIQR